MGRASGAAATAGARPGTGRGDRRNRRRRYQVTQPRVGRTPPAHVAAMSRALRDEVGYASPFLQRLSGPICAPGFSVTELHDVARFDGVRHLWVAFIEEGRLGGELGHLSAEQHAAVRRRFEDSLAEYAAADGTLRLPVAARLLRLST